VIRALGNLIEKLLQPPLQRHAGVMGIFFYVDDAAAAVRTLRQQGHRNLSVFSPMPHHEIEHALEQGSSLVRWVTFAGAMLGVTGGFALCIYVSLSYPLVVGGKELVSLPPFVVIAYESMILLGVLFNLVGMLALARLPAFRTRAPYDPRFSEDRIGIWVPCAGEAATRVQEILRGHRAEEVQVHG
jgi:hypothetical protein